MEAGIEGALYAVGDARAKERRSLCFGEEEADRTVRAAATTTATETEAEAEEVMVEDVEPMDEEEGEELLTQVPPTSRAASPPRTAA